MYDTFYAKYRKKLPDPVIGKEYDVYLKTGKTRATLKDFSDGKIVMKKPGVTVTYRLDTIHRKSYIELFPKKAAKILALMEIRKMREAERAEAAGEKEKPEGETKRTNIPKSMMKLLQRITCQILL